MEPHFNLNDDEFENQFAACKLDPVLFSHEAHIRLAWIHIKKYGTEKAIENITQQLVNFVNAIGAKGKYNHTLTVAAVKAVSHFINKTPIDNFHDFIETYPRLKYNFKELIAQHYREDIYHSEKAKQEYLEPDLLPFD